MATEPRWVYSPQTNKDVPIATVAEMVKARLDDAHRYADEAKDEKERAQHALNRLTTVSNIAEEQRAYWLRIAHEIEEWDG